MRSFLLAIMVLGCGPRAAAPRADAPPAAPALASTTPFGTVSGAFFALSVADVEASARWYHEALGLDVVMRVPKTAGQPGVAVLAGGGLTVELLQLDDARPLGVDDRFLVHGLVKAGFVVDDLHASLARLQARGVPVAMGPYPARDDQPANALIRDNAGNYLQLFERPRGRP